MLNPFFISNEKFSSKKKSSIFKVKQILTIYFISIFTFTFIDSLLIGLFVPVDWSPISTYPITIFTFIAVILIRSIIVEYSLLRMSSDNFSFKRFLISIIIFGPPIGIIIVKLGFAAVFDLTFLISLGLKYEIVQILTYLLFSLFFEFPRFFLLSKIRDVSEKSNYFSI
jgi:hypothetical protein